MSRGINMQYWLMKTEPSEYSIDNLRRDKVEPWDGVRNYQAANNLKKMLQVFIRGRKK